MSCKAEDVTASMMLLFKKQPNHYKAIPKFIKSVVIKTGRTQQSNNISIYSVFIKLHYIAPLIRYMSGFRR